MEHVAVVCMIFFLVVLILAFVKLYRAVQKAKEKQALFEERFSKNYDRYPYRNKLR